MSGTASLPAGMLCASTGDSSAAATTTVRVGCCSFVRRTRLFAAAAALAIVASTSSWTSAAPKNHAPANSAALSSLLSTKASPAGPLELGDTVTLTAGVNYDAHVFTLPAINVGTGWITFQSSAAASLPGPDTRVTAAHAQYMPKIRTTGTYIAMETANPPAVPHHYKFIGIEFSSANSNMSSYSTALVRLGKGDASQNSDALVPHHFVFDRCYFHTYDDLNQRLRRAIEIHTAYTDIINCRITGIKETGSLDSQGISGWNGPGPYRIINNYIEAASENIFFGGATSYVPNVIPSDIEVRRNHCTKPIAWRSDIRWNVKNLFEIKTARRVTLDGNIFEKCWSSRYGQQHGVALVFKTLTSGQAYKLSEDIIVRNNIIRDCGLGVLLEARDTQNTAQGVLRRVTVENNTFDVNHLLWSYDTVPAPDQHYEGSTGFNGAFLQMSLSPQDVTVRNNSIVNSAYMIAADKAALPPIPNFKFYNNILRNKDSAAPYGGVTVPTNGNATNFFNTQFTSAMVKHNVLMGAPSGQYLSPYNDNLFPAYSSTWANIYRNQPGGNVGDNYNAVVGAPLNLQTYAVNSSGVATNEPIGADAKYIHDVATYNVIAGTPRIGADDILLYASKPSATVGPWSVVSDATAVGGKAIKETDAGLAKVITALATPASYFEVTFNAQAGVEYRLWIRGKAPSNLTSSDSVHVQFTNTVDAAGNPAYRIGSTTSIEWVLEDGSGTGITNWGWRDSSWGGTVPEKRVKFATSGPQTIRCQRREDGVQIDQILLSPVKYMSTTIGVEKNDNTLLPEQK